MKTLRVCGAQSKGEVRMSMQWSLTWPVNLHDNPGQSIHRDTDRGVEMLTVRRVAIARQHHFLALVLAVVALPISSS